MKTWTVTLPDGSTTFVSTEDNQDPSDVGYDETCTWTLKDGPATATDTLKAELDGNPFAAHEWARKEITKRVEAAIAESVPEDGLAGFIMDAHAEVQIFKLMLDIKTASGIDLVPTDFEALCKRFPNVMAVSVQANIPPFDVATILETRYWPRVKAIVMARASRILAYDQVAAATTAEQMVDIAVNAAVQTEGMDDA